MYPRLSGPEFWAAVYISQSIFEKYVDCPWFLDNRGLEINIANAINIKATLAVRQCLCQRGPDETPPDPAAAADQRARRLPNMDCEI